MRFIGMPFRAALWPLAIFFLGLRWLVFVLFWPSDWYERDMTVLVMRDVCEWVVYG